MGLLLLAVMVAALAVTSAGAALRPKPSKASFIEQLHNDPVRRQAFCNNLASRGSGASCRKVGALRSAFLWTPRSCGCCLHAVARVTVLASLSRRARGQCLRRRGAVVSC